MGIIYCAINKINGKIYFGYTTEELKRRIQKHMAKVNANSTTHFHNAIRKYGFHNFIWKIIDHEENIEKLKILEKDYIYMFGTSFKKIGYNETEGGEGAVFNEEIRNKISNSLSREKGYWFGKKRSDETKKKMSESAKIKVFTSLHKKNIAVSMSKIILQKDLNGNIIKEWESAREVERKIGIKNSNINSVCLKKYGFKSAGGFLWSFK